VTSVIARAERTAKLSALALAIGIVGSLALWCTEAGYRVEQLVGLVACVALVYFDRNAENGVAAVSFAIPPIVLIDVADVFWNPSLGIVVQGALVGSLTALFAVGLALIYRANRVVNFAQGDLGAVPAILAILLLAKDAPGGAPDWLTGLAYPVAVVIGLVAAIFLGFVVERTLINRFSRAPRLVLTVATIGIAQLLTALALFMPGWFGFKNLDRPTLDPPFDIRVNIGGVFFDDNDLMVFLVVPLILLAVALFLRYARLGIAIRAAAERADRAATLGVPVGRVQTTVWVVTTVLAFVTVFLRAGVADFPIGSALGVSVLLRALAAAVIGRMENIPRIAAAAVGLGIVETALVFSTGRDLYVFPLLFVIIVVALALNRGRRGSRAQDDDTVSSWQAAREVRPIPTELKGLRIVWGAQVAIYGAVALFVLTLPLWMSNSQLLIATATGIVAIIAVSLVLLTGWAGHVSLGQMAFAAIGGAVGGWVTQHAGWDLGFAMLAGGAAGAAVAVVIGIPAARAGGLTLAVTTLALAPAVLFWLLNPEFFNWIPRGSFDEDPTLFGTVEVRSQVGFFWLTLAVLALAIAMAYGVRRSRTGRVLIALRENRRAAESYGINALRTMLAGFAMSGFLAAVAGVLFVHHQQMISQDIAANPFSADQSLRVFAIVVIGGMASLPGAILGAVYVYAMQYYMLPEWRFLATGVGLLAILLILPGGLGAGIAEARDAGLRWVAKRRRILVPSLVADRRVGDLEVSPAMAAAVAEAVDRPEVEEVVEVQS
jgi:branched-subunit amino acid ABC-type transport system permease component